jgi:hypothetical protein
MTAREKGKGKREKGKGERGKGKVRSMRTAARDVSRAF